MKKNKLTDLQDHLFEMMEKLNDDSLAGEALDTEIKRSEAFSTLAVIAVKNAELIAKCADIYGLPVLGDLPLLPASPGVITPGQPEAKKRQLLRNRDDDE